MSRPKGFTDKESLFIQEYLLDLNAAQAARNAGYRDKNTGAALLRRPVIREAIQTVMNRRAAIVGITAEKVLAGIERIAIAAESDEKYNEALKAYELLGKHLKLFTDKIELSGSVALAERLKEARERIGRRSE